MHPCSFGVLKTSRMSPASGSSSQRRRVSRDEHAGLRPPGPQDPGGGTVSGRSGSWRARGGDVAAPAVETSRGDREVNRLLARRWPAPPTSEHRWFVTSQADHDGSARPPSSMPALPKPNRDGRRTSASTMSPGPPLRACRSRGQCRAVPAFPARASKAAADTPIMPNWADAVRYCRWLSEQEGVPEKEMCYPPLHEINEKMKMRRGFWRGRAIAYRPKPSGNSPAGRRRQPADTSATPMALLTLRLVFAKLGVGSFPERG